jgi:hypothetical protein
VSQVQPYGAFNIYDGGSSGLENTKLEIATEVCAQTEMEFYLDTNGTVVFKPPFYNMDVENSSTDTYTIKPKDIINFSNDVNTDSICTYLEVYGPREQFDPSLDSIGYHIDFDLIKKFGLRYQKLDLRYGNTPDQIRLLAAAKMAKINGRAFTGSVSIPMRPEIRLGYPVYISHIDAYYYVTGINHSFSFGGAATTTLSLEFRRDRVFSDGSVKGTSPGDVLAGYVYRYTGKNDPLQFAEQKIDDSPASPKEEESKTDIETALGENDVKKWESLRDGNVISGPRPSGLYEIDKGKLNHTQSGTGKTVVQSNELIMLSFPKSGTDSTGESVPFTDLRGYRHIGAFPYGANLSLVDKDTRAADLSAPTEKSKQEAAAVTDAAPASSTGSPSSPGGSDEPMHFDEINVNPEESLTDPDGGPIETSWLAYRAEEAAKSNKNSQEVKEQVDERRRPDFNKMPTNGSKLNAYRSFKAATPLRKTEDGSSLEKTNSIITNSGISN